MPEIALVAGETSGDISGATLVRELAGRHPELRFWGAGGAAMREAGVELIADLSGGGAIGIVQSLALVPGLLRHYRKVKQTVLKRRPDLLILIDFGAFNVRLGCAARKAGIKTLYYFPPSSWRKKLKSTVKMKACADKVITPFPWSETLLRQGGVDAQFLGHPLLDAVKPSLSIDEFRNDLGLRPDSRIVGLLPGSRSHEIKYNLPEMLKAASIIAGRVPDVQFVVAAGSRQARDRINRIIDKCSVPVCITEGLTYDVMSHSELLLTCSGTATLEAAVTGTPMVIIYRGGGIMMLEYLLRRSGTLETFIGMPNIIAEKEICPELLAEKATPEAIAESALNIMENSGKALSMKEELKGVRSVLGELGASVRAAQVVLNNINLCTKV